MLSFSEDAAMEEEGKNGQQRWLKPGENPVKIKNFQRTKGESHHFITFIFMEWRYFRVATK